MIQVVPCPQCHQSAMVDLATPLATVVECPNCRARFSLRDMLEEKLGYWRIVGEQANFDDASTVTSRSAVSATASSSEIETELRLAPMLTVAQDTSSASKLETDPRGHRVRYRIPGRRKRKPRSIVWSILPVALGGIAAIPIGLILIWHVLGKDVAGAGIVVGRFVPWIVPAQFRTVDTRDPNNASTPRRASLEGSGLGRVDETVAEDASWDSMDAPKPAFGADPYSGISTVDVLVQQAATGVEHPTEIHARQSILALIRSCEASFESWEETDKSDTAELRRLAQTAYSDLVAIAEELDKVTVGALHRLMRDQMQSLAERIKLGGADVQSVIEQGARYWLSRNGSEGPYGLAIIIQVDSVELVGADWRLSLGDEESLTASGVHISGVHILVPVEISQSIQAGQRLLLLGIVAKEIAENEAPKEPVFSAGFCYQL